MRKFLISGLLLSSVMAAAPAAAQSYGYGYRGDSRFERQIDQMVDRIHRAEDRDLISQREEARLLSHARQLHYLERRYRRGGFSRWEAQDLQRRIQHLRAQFRWERFDRDGFNGWDRSYDRDRYDRYDDFEDGYYPR